MFFVFIGIGAVLLICANKLYDGISMKQGAYEQFFLSDRQEFVLLRYNENINKFEIIYLSNNTTVFQGEYDSCIKYLTYHKFKPYGESHGEIKK